MVENLRLVSLICYYTIYMHTKKTEETPTDSSHIIGIFSNFALEKVCNIQS
jgi:hypothetical protein